MTSYQFQFCGNCLGGLVPEGTILPVDPESDLKPVDLVAVILAPEEGGAFQGFVNALGSGAFVGVCKIFLGKKEDVSGEEVYLVGQLNPPCISPIPRSAIEALHRVDDDALDSPSRLTREDEKALRLLLPFAGDQPCAPVNPAWRSLQ